jgi:uncharacterized YigZ family protein
MILTILKKNAFSKLIEKKSSFIAYAISISSHDDFKNAYTELKQKHKDAKHIPYAYRLFVDGDFIQKYSDDGEPSKTAGLPLLNVLKQKNLSNTALIVVRVYGGIKLGTAGLSRAFIYSSLAVLELAGIRKKELCESISFNCSYEVMGLVESFLKKEHISYVVSSNNSSLLVSLELPYNKNHVITYLRSLL